MIKLLVILFITVSYSLLYFKTVANTTKIAACKSKELPGGNIKPPSLSDNSRNPGINNFNDSRTWVKFGGKCLKQ